MAYYPIQVQFDLTVRRYGITEKERLGDRPAKDPEPELLEELTYNKISLGEVLKKLLDYIRN